MPDFAEVVRLAQEQSGVAQLRPVVEKEIRTWMLSCVIAAMAGGNRP